MQKKCIVAFIIFMNILFKTTYCVFLKTFLIRCNTNCVLNIILPKRLQVVYKKILIFVQNNNKKPLKIIMLKKY